MLNKLRIVIDVIYKDISSYTVHSCAAFLQIREIFLGFIPYMLDILSTLNCSVVSM